jgi:acyl-CoA thioesterase
VSGVFARDIVVEPVAPGRYRASLDHSWDLLANPQGGVIEVTGTGSSGPSGHELRTCTAVFAGQVSAGELEIEVSVLRRGRSATQVVATVRNQGQESGTTTVAVFGSERRGPSFVVARPPRVPPPEECRSYREPLPEGVSMSRPDQPPFWSRIEGRAAMGHAPWEEHEPGSSDVATWLRFDNPPVADGALDSLAVLTLADRMPGSVGEMLGHRGQRWFAPSADLTVHFFEPARTEWLLAHDRARWADDGWASAETTLWSEDGTLVAYATQMMLFTYSRE